MDIALAVIGGTGLYRLAGFQDVRSHEAGTPYGEPSGAVRVGTLHGHGIAFLARHGEEHTIAPHRVNYRANLHVLHALGARRVLAVNAVGGITVQMAPRALALPNQLIDYTSGRVSSFSDAPGVKVEHIDFSEPYSPGLRSQVLAASVAAGVEVVDGGVYGATQGPRLETCAEIARMRRDGCDLVGMTGMPEAALARETGMEYAALCLVANWAAGCDASAHRITMEEVFANLEAATAKVPPLLRALLG
ncbi:MAG TPA: S-methyl-5'-thioinosine phosphorylase [Xanthomonadaceae bacterium]|nr:S-methyl-5'-thioinosine phosphorylase [Xanthomonadaceae bacterium]